MKQIQRLNFILFCLVLGLLSHPDLLCAETLDDPAPILLPSEPNGKSVLFDNMHGQTAGQADWVIDGAFSDFAVGIMERGYRVEELRKTEPLNLQDLMKHDVFIIPEANIPFKKEEQDDMIAYVENGGSIFFISDHYNADRNKNRWDSSEVMNGFRRGAFKDPTKGMSQAEKQSEAMQGVESSDWLNEYFGIRFRYNALGTVVANQIVDASDTFGITEGISAVTMHAGSTLAITDPTRAKGIVYVPKLDSNAKWGPSVDEGVYHGGGIAEGPYAAISKLGLGKAAFIGDSSPVEDAIPKYRNEETGKQKKTYDGFIEADNRQLLLNMVDWLAQQESYETFDQADVSLDAPSPLLTKEYPENTTEPQAEPWSQPSPTYLWFDSSTFASGSFGSSEQPLLESTYSLTYETPLTQGEPFSVQVKMEGLKPGQMMTGYTLGIYIAGGQQIAKVQNEDGSWPSHYGYSSPFTLIANENGVATKQLFLKLDEKIEGDVNIRLRQGKANLLTESVTIGTSGSIEEPPQIMSLQQARNVKDGTVVKVAGTVTTKPGLFGGQGFFMQDDEAGIYVFQREGDIQRGDYVQVQGTVQTFQGKKELTEVQHVKILGQRELPAFQQVDQIDERNQGKRITLEGSIQQLKAYPNAFEFEIQNDNRRTKVRVDQRTGVTMEDFISLYEEGDIVSVSGIASIHYETYQLLVTDLGHVQKLTSSTPPVIGDLPFTTFDITNTYDIPVPVTDLDGDLDEVHVKLNGVSLGETIAISPLAYKPGRYELTIRATDQAGHRVEKTYEVEAVIHLGRLDELVKYGKTQSYLDDKMEQHLLKKVIDVQRAKNDEARLNKWNALRHQIRVQSGKKIEPSFLPFWDVPVEMKKAM
ncbi:uncharacterized protein YdeI (BOF family) [Oikeobacillus pervagus]|uniref:Uncharacterized protein YdeI (BOF family) n=1 Tax=Oikeobacillus pervagus TaxID=1325931 RepID=A0AAJ1SYI9_9BACI|nr:endonuclease [Oikeobacillus pervagus]MDQ0215149.1 uncharacterized protein YdeI (BOF family) [Oikeobacillus pervagus]